MSNEYKKDLELDSEIQDIYQKDDELDKELNSMYEKDEELDKELNSIHNIVENEDGKLSSIEEPKKQTNIDSSEEKERDLLQTIADKTTGAIIGGGVGYGVGKGLGKTGETLENLSDQWRFDQLSDIAPTASRNILEEKILREGKPFVDEKFIGKAAKKAGIGGKLGFYNKENAAIEAQKFSRSAGKSQGDFLKLLESQASDIPKEEIYREMLDEYNRKIGKTEGSSAYSELESKWSPIQLYNKQDMLNRYNELKKYHQDARNLGLPIPKEEIAELNRLENQIDTETPSNKLTLSQIEKEKSSIPYEIDAESNLQKSRQIRAGVLRDKTESVIENLPDGAKKLQKFKDLKKQTSASKILEELTMEGAKKNKGFFKEILSKDLTEVPTHLVKKTLKGGKNILEPVAGISGKALKGAGKVAPWLGAIVGGFTGAASAKEGERISGAAQGIAESFTPESVGYSELPKTQLGREALEQEMRIKTQVGMLPIEEKVKVVDSLKSKLDYTPEEIQQVSEKLLQMKGGESFANVLNQAAQQSDRTRKSIVFGLLQQPAFRELMKKVESGK